MDYRRVLGEMFPDKNHYCDDSYESIVWWETDIPKPTNEELCRYYENVKNKWALLDMKDKRNMLLSSSDFRVVSDYPDRDKWLIYRQKLRDLPINWTPETPFPEEPQEPQELFE